MADGGWNIELVRPFVGKSVLVSISGLEGEERPKAVAKRVIKIKAEEDVVKVYFDAHTFVAVPARSSVEASGDAFAAYDAERELTYRISLCKSWLV